MMLHSSIVLVCSILVQVTLSIDPPDCKIRYDDPCDGIAASGNMTQMLETLYDHFCGCVYVTGAIRIQVTQSDIIVDDTAAPLTESNFSFFYHIREIHDYLYLENIPQIDRISFPNLRLIRGESLTSGYALDVFNSSISNLYMPNLTEITKGNIRFSEDKSNFAPSLCNVLTVNWADILPLNRRLTHDLDKCTDQFKPNCSSLGCDFCWCDDFSADQCCQELTRECLSQCGGNRCHRQIKNGATFINCCNSVCAGGCDGINDTHCRACKLPTVHVLNGDTCEANCPARFSSTGVENPDYLFRHRDLCVKPCPSGTFELNDTVCVEVCPTGMRSVPSETGGIKCEICDGYYCKECKGNYYQTLEDNCTLITGNLFIDGNLRIYTSTGWSYISDFPKLKSIQVVRGLLRIHGLRVEHFPYLSNLEVLGNDTLDVGLCYRYPYRLGIDYNYDLVSIDLSSLKKVIGGVRMFNNPKLCLAGNFNKFVSYGILSHQRCLVLSSTYRRPLHDCVADNIVCHPECNPIDGCWGTTDADCVTCINHQYNGRCVPTCEDYSKLGEYLYNNYLTKKCETCHELCEGCSGKGPTRCHSCKTGVFSTINSGGSFECLDRCIINTYAISRHGNHGQIETGTTECLPCSSSCTNGCVGPLSIIDHSNGCLTCDTVILNRTGHQVMCTNERECPEHHYNSTTLLPCAKQICIPCHENCRECDGPKLTDCTSCRIGQQCHIDTTISTAAAASPSSTELDSTTTFSSSNTRGTSFIGSPVSTDSSIASFSSSTGTSLDWLYFIILPVVVTVLLVIAVLGGFHYRKHKRKYSNTPVGSGQTIVATTDRELIHYNAASSRLLLGKQQSALTGIEDTASRSFTLSQVPSQQQLISSSSLKIPQDVLIPHFRITIFESIGQGEFGVVYRASLLEYTIKTTVAVKTIKGDYTPKELNDLLEESLLMRGINHSNVMGLIGICTDGETPFIVLPYMEGGSLLTYLRTNKDSLFISSAETAAKIGQVQMKLTKICLQIARGMEYLAKMKLIHRDLAARNCMLDSQCNVKVADFGLSKGLYYKVYFKQEKNESVKLPVKWLAIESMEYGMFSEKSDVWAYGVTCWEVFSCGKIPYGGVAPNSVLRLLKSDQRMEKPENAACSDKIFHELMMKCWKALPEKRPCFSEIVKYLDKLVPSVAGCLVIANESSKATNLDDDGAYSNDGLFKQLTVQEDDVENPYT